MSNSDLAINPLTHNEIEKIAKNFFQLLPYLSRKELLRLVEVNEGELMIPTLANLINSCTDQKSRESVENMSFWYSIKPATLLCIDQYMHEVTNEKVHKEFNTVKQNTDEGIKGNFADNLVDDQAEIPPNRKRHTTFAENLQLNCEPTAKIARGKNTDGSSGDTIVKASEDGVSTHLKNLFSDEIEPKTKYLADISGMQCNSPGISPCKQIPEPIQTRILTSSNIDFSMNKPKRSKMQEIKQNGEHNVSELATILINGRSFIINKYLLAAHSQDFREIFFRMDKNDGIGGREVPRQNLTEITFNNVSSVVFEEFYKILNAPSIGNEIKHESWDLDPKMAVEILEHIKKYPCDIVRRAIQARIIASQKWVDDAAENLTIAHNYGLLELERRCLEIILRKKAINDSFNTDCEFDDEVNKKIAAYVTGRYEWKLRKFRQTLDFYSLSEDPEISAFQHAGGGDSLFSIAENKDSARNCVYWHIHLDIAKLLGNESNLNVEVSIHFRIKSTKGSNEDLIRHYTNFFNSNAPNYSISLGCGTLFSRKHEFYDVRLNGFNYVISIAINGIWKYEREDYFKNGIFVNKFLLGAYSRKFREGIFSDSDFFEANILPLPLSSDLEIIERILNPYYVDTQIGIKKCYTSELALQIAEIWSTYKIEPFKSVCEDFFKRALEKGEMQLHEFYRIAFMFKIPNMMDHCTRIFETSPDKFLSTLQKILATNSQLCEKLKPYVVDLMKDVNTELSKF